MAPGVRHELHRRVQRNDQGRPTQKLTQYLTPEEGKPEMRRLLEGVIVAMKLSGSWKEFQAKLDLLYPILGDTLQRPFEGTRRLPGSRTIAS